MKRILTLPFIVAASISLTVLSCGVNGEKKQEGVAAVYVSISDIKDVKNDPYKMVDKNTIINNIFQNMDSIRKIGIHNRNVNEVDFFTTNRFKVTHASILSGIASDVLLIPKNDIPFYAHKDLLVPIDRYILRKENYVHEIKVGSYIYGIGISFCPWYYLLFNQHIIVSLGLEDPIKQWLEGKWTWDRFFGTIGTVREELTYKDGEGFVRTPDVLMRNAKLAFYASNGCEFLVNDEYGNYLVNLDHKYSNVNDVLTAYESILSNIHRLDMFPSYNLMSKNECITYIDKLINQDYQMLYGLIPNGVLMDDGVATMVGMEKVGMVCFPRGPDLDGSLSSRDIGNYAVYAIPISSKKVEEAAMLINRLLFDNEHVISEGKRYLSTIYKESAALFDYGTEWAGNSTYMFTDMWGKEIDRAFDNIINIYPDDDNRSRIAQIQSALDRYVNIFEVEDMAPDDGAI
ncbi:MAG: hypothetical protein FWE70_04285 [Oscillospiraceae bacterium]|nr:hypothetical protein [Oscillospiraceae bacterium]